MGTFSPQFHKTGRLELVDAVLIRDRFIPIQYQLCVCVMTVLNMEQVNSRFIGELTKEAEFSYYEHGLAWNKQPWLKLKPCFESC